jgi:hypothetical protein
MEKLCRKCGVDLLVGENWKPSSEKRKDYICSECRKPLLVRDRLVIKESTIMEYGGICACCKEATLEFLTIDHIDETGAQERKSLNMNGGHQFYYWLKMQGYPKGNYQVLCFNCNFAKHVYGKCPHQS